MDMEPINIHLNDEAGIVRFDEPIQLGIPISKGVLQPDENLQLTNSFGNKEIQCQSDPMVFWPDGSVRWLKLSFVISKAPSTQLALKLNKANPEASQLASPLRYQYEGDTLCVFTGLSEFRFPKGKLSWDASSGSESSVIPHELKLTTISGAPCSAVMESSWHVTEAGPVSVTVSAQGAWQAPDRTVLARFRFSLRVFANSPTVELQTCIHNPRRAQHPGGLWDLGDPGSVNFRALTVHAKVSNASKAWLTPSLDQSGFESNAENQLYLYQDSSGGDQWQSRNHVDAEGRITTSFRGYRVHSGEELIHSGDRASPIAGLSNQNGISVQGSIKHFWQNFPSAIGSEGNVLVLGLFPPDTSFPYELQGGERKTQTAWLCYGDNKAALYWTQAPLVPTLDPEHFEKTEAFDWFEANRPRDLLDDLILEGLEGESNFFAKRETIDEYGWRNFGDIFADHETLYQADGELPYISHYNNQYDAIYGFARQFALTADRRWFELMDDLARHVSDIDIYHTEEDRCEYNNGLFWHTDHYLDAHTSTHRTFSKQNKTSSTPGQTGGGPAAEHCYTTGLMYHYLITGCENSRQSVFELAKWMIALHEGQGGFLEQVLALKKFELPQLKALIRGKRVSRHKYPFTRGTGNYINTLLDASLLEPSGFWLECIERIICDTIHPLDDITERKLLNAETGWSYLVLLASLARYLQHKVVREEKDELFYFTKEAFLNYTHWMLSNEQLFLATPWRLEFPNATWAAQDIRKAMLMFLASKFAHNHSASYQAKGSNWLNRSLADLTTSKEKGFTRIQIICLQNYGPHYSLEPTATLSFEGDSHSIYLDDPKLTWKILFLRIVSRIQRGFISFRPRKEWAWLNSRLSR